MIYKILYSILYLTFLISIIGCSNNIKQFDDNSRQEIVTLAAPPPMNPQDDIRYYGDINMIFKNDLVLFHQEKKYAPKGGCMSHDKIEKINLKKTDVDTLYAWRIEKYNIDSMIALKNNKDKIVVTFSLANNDYDSIDQLNRMYRKLIANHDLRLILRNITEEEKLIIGDLSD